MHDASLQRSLRATLSYFDLFDHPLTLMELARYRYRFSNESAGGRNDGAEGASNTPALSDMLTALDAIGAGTEDGFWFLPARAAIVASREHRYRLAEAKFRKARRVARFMRLLPSVRLVAVCNSLALANANEESDIDLFVVARPGTLWVTRLLVVGSLALLGLRPSSRTSADKVCMSFFVSERRLDLHDIALQPDDTYLRYWIASLAPLYDAGGVMDAFLAANAWAGERVPGALAVRRRPVLAAAPFSTPLLPLLRAADPLARKLQSRLFPSEISANANAGTDVMVSDDILKFHVTDRRAEFESAFRGRIASSV